MSSQLDTIKYDNHIVQKFAWATIIFGIVGMTVGILIALQLVTPWFNFDLPYTTFGRLRPLHTNAVIFAFVGNGIFMGVYYSLQRLVKAPMYSKVLSNIHFWGWQLIIVSAAITLPLGITSSAEYAELEWPIDIAIAIVWVVFGINMIGTIIKRRERHLYVAVWFYLATWVTVTMLHIIKNLEIPVSWTYSYPVFTGVQDALVQWWYGHNAVAFFLTTPYLGLMYYFLPKAANRPIYSYRLSIIHFWSLIFIYIWAGPHHLLYTSLPDWAQTLGMVFSLMLIAPSWGGMLNGLLTLRGAWDKVRNDPILKFMVVAVTAYGMSTFEGPMMSIKAFNAVTHYTDWTIAHVHVGALGWNGMLTFGVLYWLIPKIYNTKLYSVKLANTHFWMGTIAIIVYAIPLYWAGVTQYLMWRDFTPEGFLQYGNFLETVTQLIPMYALRALGGLMFLTGIITMLYNLVKTMKQGKLEKEEVVQVEPMKPHIKHKGEYWHRWLERKGTVLTVLATIAVIIGGLIEIVPMMMLDSQVPKIATVQPYTPLELQGRDIYIKEGCVGCHSQMIRPFRFETERYGEFSKSGEFIYDRPFLWGSKRTGPDLHRVGGKYPDSWHYNHMLDPESMSPGSIMPSYPWLITNDLDTTTTRKKIEVLRMLGTPYEERYEDRANLDLHQQALLVANRLRTDGIEGENLENKEIVALIAYLQRLGTDISKTNIPLTKK